MPQEEISPDAEPSPLELLHQKPFEELQPTDIQAAINYLDPQSPRALQEAEDVLGYAEAGHRHHPEDADWWNVLERAEKIFNHRRGPRDVAA